MSYCKRELYAVQTGDYAGQMFAVIEPSKDFVGCLSLPVMENVKVPKESFETGRNSNIIKFIEKLPRNVYSVVEAQYKKNENSNNRRQQLNTPNVLYSKDSVEEDEKPLGLPGK